MNAERMVQEARIREWFVDHHAIFTERDTADDTQWDLKILYWGKPGTGMYSIRYVIMGPVLMVWGDLECAVYRWSSPITWKFLAGCDLQYFAGKCEASPKGRTFEEYDAHQALLDFDDRITRMVEEDGARLDPKIVQDARRAIRHGTDEWHEWMQTNGQLLFGGDWYEYLPGLGMEIAQTCAAHLLGIKLAVAQRAKSELRSEPSMVAAGAKTDA
jgi:hypothetical protein